MSAHRIDYLDRLRGLAVVAMFFVHSAGAWLAPAVRESSYWDWAMRVSGMVAPVFMFLAGVSVSLIAKRAQGSKKKIGPLRRQLAIRGLKIVLLGYALHMAFWAASGFGGSWIRILKVDVLHCIGFSLVVLPFVAWPHRRFNWQALILFLAFPLVSHLTFRLPMEQWLGSGLASYLSVRPKLALFPFFPYAAWVSLGLFVGPIFASALDGQDEERRFWKGMFVAAVLAYAVGKGIKIIYYQFDMSCLGGSEVPKKGLFHWFFMKAAVVFAVFFALRASTALFDRGSFSPIVLLGQTSLFAYCVHLMIIYHVAGPYLSRSLHPLGHIIGTVLLAAVMCFFSAAWRRYKVHYKVHYKKKL